MENVNIIKIGRWLSGEHINGDRHLYVSESTPICGNIPKSAELTSPIMVETKQKLSCPICKCIAKTYNIIPESKICADPIINKKHSPEYVSIHMWLYKNHGPASKCEHCSKDASCFHWARRENFGYARDVNNFIQLCVSCHRKYDADAHPKKRKYLRVRPFNCRPVYKYSKEGVIISQYPSLTEAAKDCGIGMSAISNALAGTAKTAAKFIWKYI